MKNSPFGSASTSSAQAKADATLEFRGVFVDSGETFFSLYDGATRTSLWVGLKEAGNPFVVQSYDEAKGTVSVEFQGQVHAVTLKQAKILAFAAPVVGTPGYATPGAGTPAASGAGTVAVAGPASPDEAARLAQIAEEIRRRRAIRSQASQGPRGPAPADPASRPTLPASPPSNRP